MDNSFLNAIPPASLVVLVTVEIYPKGAGLTNVNVQKVVINSTTAGGNITDATELRTIVLHVKSVLRKNNSAYTNLELITYNTMTNVGIDVTHTIATEDENFETMPLDVIPSVFLNGVKTKELSLHFSKPV